MTKNAFAVSLLSAIASITLLAAAPAQAGSHVVQPGVTAQIDVAERGGYTTIVVVNRGNAAGSLQIPAGGGSVIVPANGDGTVRPLRQRSGWQCLCHCYEYRRRAVAGDHALHSADAGAVIRICQLLSAAE